MAEVGNIVFGKRNGTVVQLYDLFYILHLIVCRQLQLVEYLEYQAAADHLMAMKGPAMAGFELLRGRLAYIVQQRCQRNQRLSVCLAILSTTCMVW